MSFQIKIVDAIIDQICNMEIDKLKKIHVFECKVSSSFTNLENMHFYTFQNL